MPARAVILNIVIILKPVMVAGCIQNMAEGLITFPLNLTVPYYFETFIVT